MIPSRPSTAPTTRSAKTNQQVESSSSSSSSARPHSSSGSRSSSSTNNNNNNRNKKNSNNQTSSNKHKHKHQIPRSEMKLYQFRECAIDRKTVTQELYARHETAVSMYTHSEMPRRKFVDAKFIRENYYDTSRHNESCVNPSTRCVSPSTTAPHTSRPPSTAAGSVVCFSRPGTARSSRPNTARTNRSVEGNNKKSHHHNPHSHSHGNQEQEQKQHPVRPWSATGNRSKQQQDEKVQEEEEKENNDGDEQHIIKPKKHHVHENDEIEDEILYEAAAVEEKKPAEKEKENQEKKKEEEEDHEQQIDFSFTALEVQSTSTGRAQNANSISDQMATTQRGKDRRRKNSIRFQHLTAARRVEIEQQQNQQQEEYELEQERRKAEIEAHAAEIKEQRRKRDERMKRQTEAIRQRFEDRKRELIRREEEAQAEILAQKTAEKRRKEVEELEARMAADFDRVLMNEMRGRNDVLSGEKVSRKEITREERVLEATMLEREELARVNAQLATFEMDVIWQREMGDRLQLNKDEKYTRENIKCASDSSKQRAIARMEERLAEEEATRRRLAQERMDLENAETLTRATHGKGEERACVDASLLSISQELNELAHKQISERFELEQEEATEREEGDDESLVKLEEQEHEVMYKEHRVLFDPLLAAWKIQQILNKLPPEEEKIREELEASFLSEMTETIESSFTPAKAMKLFRDLEQEEEETRPSIFPDELAARKELAEQIKEKIKKAKKKQEKRRKELLAQVEQELKLIDGNEARSRSSIEIAQWRDRNKVEELQTATCPDPDALRDSVLKRRRQSLVGGSGVKLQISDDDESEEKEKALATTTSASAGNVRTEQSKLLEVTSEDDDDDKELEGEEENMRLALAARSKSKVFNFAKSPSMLELKKEAETKKQQEEAEEAAFAEIGASSTNSNPVDNKNEDIESARSFDSNEEFEL